MTQDMPFSDLLDSLDRHAVGGSARQRAEVHLRAADDILEAWLASKGLAPTDAAIEGFRLLALHRQAARGDPTFNACRETCREIVYLRNVAAQYDGDTPEALNAVRLQEMVLRHLALFVGGKMVEAGLGDFCCSSRPLRQGAGAVAHTPKGQAVAASSSPKGD